MEPPTTSEQPCWQPCNKMPLHSSLSSAPSTKTPKVPLTTKFYTLNTHTMTTCGMRTNLVRCFPAGTSGKTPNKMPQPKGTSTYSCCLFLSSPSAQRRIFRFSNVSTCPSTLQVRVSVPHQKSLLVILFTVTSLGRGATHSTQPTPARPMPSQMFHTAKTFPTLQKCESPLGSPSLRNGFASVCGSDWYWTLYDIGWQLGGNYSVI